MSDINVSFSEEEFDEMREGTKIFLEVVDTARQYALTPEFYTKEEIAATFSEFIDLMVEIVTAGTQLMEGTAEISQMTSDPSST